MSFLHFGLFLLILCHVCVSQLPHVHDLTWFSGSFDEEAGGKENVLNTAKLAALKDRFRATNFVWLMGADNLAQIPRWLGWQQIFRLVPVAVFDRPTYALGALAGKAARRFARQCCAERSARGLARKEAPAWVFLHSPLMPQSASAIRASARAQAERPDDKGD